jgi:diguanylate cyclase (GGDEF)-like protein
LPLIGFSYEAYLDGAGFHLLARLDEPVHALMAVLPLLSGLAFYRIGLSRQELLLSLGARERAERRLVQLSLVDRLTGLPNRMALEREIGRFIDARGRGRFRPAVLLLDLDKFKHVNDTLGHDAGDELLLAFSTRMKSLLGPMAQLFRLGGDEFVVIVAGNPADGDIARLCRVIEKGADQPFELGAGCAVTGVSIGIDFLEQTDRAMADVLKRADIALYTAKDVHGSAHAFHTGDLSRRTLERMQMEQDIARGLANGEFFLEYQPIVSAASRELRSLEALVRWRHPRNGVLTPDAFLPVAERSGHMMALGRWVTSQAIADAATWPAGIGVAINVSGDELRDNGYVEHVRACLARHRFEAARLTIEITESIFTIDIADVRAGLEQLRAMGARVALDDFGVGFSSISHLREFPIDRLKIDRSFTTAILEGARDRELVDVILKLGRAFDIETTVEGVENEEQMNLIRELGAGDVQGFLIARPMAVDRLAALFNLAGSRNYAVAASF